MYHSHDAPVPREPPLTDNVVGLPEQTGLTVTLIEVGAVEGMQVLKRETKASSP